MLVAYTAVIGYGLLAGSIAADNSFGLIALACLIPAFVGFYGFAASRANRDLSLLLSGVGWTCAALALMLEQGALTAARNSAAPGEFVVPPDTPLGTIFFGFLAVAFGTAGAVLGYQTWVASIASRNF